MQKRQRTARGVPPRWVLQQTSTHWRVVFDDYDGAVRPVPAAFGSSCGHGIGGGEVPTSGTSITPLNAEMRDGNGWKRNAVRAPKVKLGAIGAPYFPSLLLRSSAGLLCRHYCNDGSSVHCGAHFDNSGSLTMLAAICRVSSPSDFQILGRCLSTIVDKVILDRGVRNVVGIWAT
jgi:hypothetical protein